MLLFSRLVLPAFRKAERLLYLDFVSESQARTFGSKSKKPELIFRTIQEEDEKQLTEFLGREYFPRECVSRALGTLTPREFRYMLDDVYPQVFKDGVSVLAQCSKSVKIVGACLACLETLVDSKAHPFTADNADTRKVKMIYDIDDELINGINLYNTFGVGKVLYLCLGLVQKESERSGIAIKLALESEKRGIQHGAELAYAEATGTPARKSLESLQYDVIKEITFRINPYGTSIYEKDGTDIFCSLLVKRLTN